MNTVKCSQCGKVLTPRATTWRFAPEDVDHKKPIYMGVDCAKTYDAQQAVTR